MQHYLRFEAWIRRAPSVALMTGVIVVLMGWGMGLLTPKCFTHLSGRSPSSQLSSLHLNPLRNLFCSWGTMPTSWWDSHVSAQTLASRM